ncbi:toxin-antitoxin system, toxin component, RelE family [Trichinella spiralis]|nr:toxin-antitoxin system, toxin component, RelE family [Trichinella spiralis]
MLINQIMEKPFHHIRENKLKVAFKTSKYRVDDANEQTFFKLLNH